MSCFPAWRASFSRFVLTQALTMVRSSSRALSSCRRWIPKGGPASVVMPMLRGLCPTRCSLPSWWDGHSSSTSHWTLLSRGDLAIYGRGNSIMSLSSDHYRDTSRKLVPWHCRIADSYLRFSPGSPPSSCFVGSSPAFHKCYGYFLPPVPKSGHRCLQCFVRLVSKVSLEFGEGRARVWTVSGA